MTVMHEKLTFRIFSDLAKEKREFIGENGFHQSKWDKLDWGMRSKLWFVTGWWYQVTSAYTGGSVPIICIGAVPEQFWLTSQQREQTDISKKVH